MRKHYIDNIRIGTVLLVVLYHVIYMFNHIITAGVIGPVTSVHGQDVIQYLLYPWFMVILFIISGMSAKYYLENHSDKEFIRARTRKLLVPSTISLFVIGWLQGYFNMAISGAFSNIPDSVPGFVLYPIMVVSGVGVLWTLQVLWVVSLVLVLLRKIEKGRLLKIGAKANMVVLLLLGIVVWGAAQILNTPVICVYRFGIYGCAFLLGYYVFSEEAVTDRLKKYCIPLSAIAVALGIAYTYIYYGENYAEAPVVKCPLAIAYAWLMCLAIIGCMKRWGDKSNAFAAFCNKKSFGLYVFHYLALSATAYELTQHTALPGWSFYLIGLVAAYAGGLLCYEIIVRIPIVRWCVLGVKKEKKNV